MRTKCENPSIRRVSPMVVKGENIGWLSDEVGEMSAGEGNNRVGQGGYRRSNPNVKREDTYGPSIPHFILPGVCDNEV